jgi:Bacterial extracellular solute-binding protein
MSGEPSAEPPAPSYEPLQEALNRAVARPWWRRWLSRNGRPWWQGIYPVVGALGAVVLLSLIGIAAPWDSGPSPARGGDTLGPNGSVLLSPTPSPADPRSIVSRPEAGQTAAPTPCEQPLSVVTAPDITGPVRELVGPLTSGACPRATVTAQDPTATLDALADGGTAPDVWIPDSSLWLRLAASEQLPTTGTSIARTPVVLAVPQPVADQLRSEQAWPVWLVFYDKVTTGEIPRMSMPPPESTVGALTLVAFAAAADYHWADDGEGHPFLHMLNFRNHLASTGADPEALLDRLAGTPVAQSGTAIGVFPVTERRLLAYLDSDPPTPAVATGTHEAMSEADYPMAISRSLDGRLAEIADELEAQLRSPAAIQRLVELGFRPPRGEQIRPAALDDTSRFPEYPEPVSLPDAAGWQKIVSDWSYGG